MSTTQASARTQHVPTPDVRVAPRTLRRLYGLQTSKRRFGRDLLTVLAWSSVAMALALWVADGGIQAIDSSAKVFLAAGTAAGLVATDLMVIMLFLAARLPLIDRSLGHDRAIALHNKLGRWVVFGLLFHAVLLVCGYAADSSTGLVEEIASLLGISDLLLSVIALGALAAVGISSMVVVKRKLPYEVWHVIHLATYVAVGLSLPHQFSMSGVFAEGTWQRWYWAALFAAVALAILSFRMILPIVSSLEHRLVVSRVVLVDTERRHDRDAWQADRPARGRSRPVLHVALPRPRPVVAPAPLLALGLTHRRHAAHHDPRAGSRHRQAAERAPRNQGRHRGAVRGSSPTTPARSSG